MRYFFLIIVGLIIGVTIAFLISEISADWGYAICTVSFFILLLIGIELLPLIRKAPALSRPWNQYRYNDDEEETNGDV